MARSAIERLTDRHYQLCIIDPEGDYSTLDDIVTVGSRVRAPHIGEILERLSDPEAQVVVNLLGSSRGCRPCARAPGAHIGYSSTRFITSCPPSGDLHRPPCRSASAKRS